jgi:hypothetical protein
MGVLDIASVLKYYAGIAPVYPHCTARLLKKTARKNHRYVSDWLVITVRNRLLCVYEFVKTIHNNKICNIIQEITASPCRTISVGSPGC